MLLLVMLLLLMLVMLMLLVVVMVLMMLLLSLMLDADDAVAKLNMCGNQDILRGTTLEWKSPPLVN